MKYGVSSHDLTQDKTCYMPVGTQRRLLARIIDGTLYMLVGLSSIFLIPAFPIRNRTEIISIFQPEPLPPPPPYLYIEINAVPDVDPWTLVFFLHLVGALFLVFPALLYELILTATKGQTIGKMVTNIKIINKDTGQAPGWTKSTARWAVLYLPILIPIIGIPIFILTLLSTLLSKNRQGWHDKIAKTKVISSSTGKILEKCKVPLTGANKRLRLSPGTVDWILYPIAAITTYIWLMAFARWIVRYLPILIPIIGIPIFILTLLSTLLSKNRQGWHDKIAKTKVISSSTEKIIQNSMVSSVVNRRLRLVSRTVDWILHPIVAITVCIWLMAMLESAGSTFIDIYSEYSSEAIEPTTYSDREWEAGELLRFDYGSRAFSQYLYFNFWLHLSIIGFVIILLYELPLTALRGQTTGKILTKTRVVCVNNGQIPGWKKAGIRWTTLYLPLLVIPIIGIPVFFLTAASPLFDRRRRGWHDKLAGTIVVPISELPRVGRTSGSDL